MGKVYDSQDVDELILLDISASQENREPDWFNIERVANECSMPLTIGGGVSSVEIIQRLLRIGADKVAINSAGFKNPGLYTEASRVFGSQCLVASIDCVKHDNGKYEVLIEGGYEPTGVDPVEFAQRVEAAGAGEILVTAIERDGTMMGYDLDLIKSVSDAVSIPVIGNGGAGLLSDLVAVIQQGGASAAACASIFNFTDNKPIKARAFMQQYGVHVRPT